jgi:hypothetical protein
MKLTTVLGSVNDNKDYYLFIPKQIKFWSLFNIKFIAIYVGDKIPVELKEYEKNIILWSKNKNLKSAYIAQNIRIYYPALLSLPDDEMVMITDMDMLPTNSSYYKDGLDKYNKQDFIYYRNIDIQEKQIYMCYNAAHPSLWSKLFKINNEDDIESILNLNYEQNYTGIPGDKGWYIDQIILYNTLTTYPYLRVLERPINRIEMYMLPNFMHQYKLNKYFGKNICNYFHDAHFHRSYTNNIKNIEFIEKIVTSPL